MENDEARKSIIGRKRNKTYLNSVELNERLRYE